MGKNTKGGSKHKKYARNRNLISRNKLSDLKKTENQEYAFVQDVLGNCRFKLMCWDKKERLGTLRGKMKKRQWISRGELVLVGLRDFQDDKCDIIQKYSADQAKILKNNNLVSEAFIKDGKTFDEDNENENYVYDDDDDDLTSNQNSKTNNDDEINMSDIDFDDI